MNTQYNYISKDGVIFKDKDTAISYGKEFEKIVYSKADLLSQEIFAIEFFSWLNNWEQLHLIQKYNLKTKTV
jgi:hypothetical protein